MSVAKRLLPLAAATCVSIIGLGILIPIVPYYFIDLGGAKEDAPLAFSAFSAAALLSAPFWGRISDRIGRRPVMLASAAGTMASYIWLAYAGSLWELFACRILAGLSAGWAAAALAYVADVTSETDRAKGMGLIGASFGLGFTIGPGIGGWAVGDGLPDYTLPLLGSAGFALIGLAIAAVFITEPTQHTEDRPAGPQFSVAVLKEERVARLLFLYFGVYVVFTAFEGVLAIWLHDRFDFGARDLAPYLVFAGIVAVIVQGGGVGRLSKRIGEAKVVLMAIVAMVASLVAILFSDSPAMVYLPIGLLALAMGLFGPAMQSLFSRAAPEGMKGAILGAGQSSMSTARILGPAGGGFFFGWLGASAPFLIGLALLIAALLFALTLLPRFPRASA